MGKTKKQSLEVMTFHLEALSDAPDNGASPVDTMGTY